MVTTPLLQPQVSGSEPSSSPSSPTQLHAKPLVLVTFDENETYSISNRIFSILLGDSVDSSLIGTTDSNYYNHYSEISTVEGKLDLYTSAVGCRRQRLLLRRRQDWRCRSHLVRTNSNGVPFSDYYFNSSYPGISTPRYGPTTSTRLPFSKRGKNHFACDQDQWISQQAKNYYHGELEIPDGAHPPVYPYAY